VHITQWEQAGDTRTGRGAICFRNPQNEVIATLPTFRRNGLWYTEIAAVPATAPATVRSLEAPAVADMPDYHSAITDSDRHHPSLSSFDIDNDTEAPIKKSDTAAADALDAHVAEGVVAAEAVLHDIDTVQDHDIDSALPAVPPYNDPYIATPAKPPRHKKVSFIPSMLRSNDPTAPHIEDIHPTKPARTSKKYTAPKQTYRDWHGHTPPVPKQGKSNNQPSPAPAPGNQLLTELWHHRMGHPGTPKLRKTQQHTTGIPTLGPLHPLFGCNNCNIAKLTKQARGKEDSGAARINGE
jgi:hypothetical protein